MVSNRSLSVEAPAIAFGNRFAIGWLGWDVARLDSEDMYKRLKLMRDIDDIIVETAPMIEAHRLDLDTVRDALLFEFGAKAG